MSNLTFGKKRRRINYDLLHAVITWALQILAVCIVAFVIVVYFGQRVSVVGDSMSPELKNGNIVLLNKLAYDIGKPKRGDVIAFRPNGIEGSHASIKRVIGLPGETISLNNGEILIDGNPIEEDYKTTEILIPGILEEAVTLGKNEYFVLGDDRQNSEDSRMPNIGLVDIDDIDGKVWFNLSMGEQFGLIK